MSRKSYPISLLYSVLSLLLIFSIEETTAQSIHNTAKQRQEAVSSHPFWQSPWALLLLIAVIIGFSIVYRRFMYSRLLTNKRNQAAMQAAGTTWTADQSIDGALEQAASISAQDNVKTHTQLVHNLLHTIDLLREQVAFFQEEVVTDTLHETSQRLYTLTLIHNNISRKAHLEFIEVNELVPMLVEHYTSFSGNQSMVRFIYSSAARTIELPIHQALSLAFFINDVLCVFGLVKSGSYFGQTVGIYLQETDGHIKLTIRTEGLNVPGGSLKRNLNEKLHKYFPEIMNPRLTIDQSMGTSINLQFQKKLSKVPVIY
jgi:two-component sensor histidine kinase